LEELGHAVRMDGERALKKEVNGRPTRRTKKGRHR